LSWPAAIFFHEQRLIRVLQVFSIIFVMMAIPVVPTAILTRRMAFRALTAAQLIGAVLGTAIAIVLAINGAEVWSLVFGTLTSVTITGAITWVLSSWRPKLSWNWSATRGLRAFSLNLSGFNALNYFSRNADNLLVGRYLGSVPLGFYQMAYTLMTYPLTNFSALICQVVFPAMAKVQDDDERLRSAYIRTCMFIALGTFPAMLGLTVTASPFVEVMLGRRWVPVAQLLTVFGPLGLAQSVYTTSGLIYNCKGRSDLQFRWGAFAATLYVASFVVGLRWGIEGVAICYAIVWALLMVPGFAIPFRLVGLSGSKFFGALWPILQASLVMAAVAWLWLLGLYRAGIDNAAIRLLSAAGVGSACYVGLLLWWRPPAVEELGIVLTHLQLPLARKLGHYLAGSQRQVGVSFRY